MLRLSERWEMGSVNPFLPQSFLEDQPHAWLWPQHPQCTGDYTQSLPSGVHILGGGRVITPVRTIGVCSLGWRAVVNHGILEER